MYSALNKFTFDSSVSKSKLARNSFVSFRRRVRRAGDRDRVPDSNLPAAGAPTTIDSPEEPNDPV